MKYFCSILLFSLFVITEAVAQDLTTVDAARLQTDRLSKVYELDAYQSKQLYKIEQRYQEQMNEIAAFRETQADLFRQKRRSILSGRKLAIRRLLREEQLLIFNEQQSILRKRRAKRLAQLKKEGASAGMIEDALFELETVR